jgi:hypothetical protein
MTSGFEMQESQAHRAFSRSAARPQQVGVREREPKAEPARPEQPKRPAEPKTFQAAPT